MTRRALIWLWVACCGGALAAGGAPNRAVTPELILAEQAYDTAKARYETNSMNDEIVLPFARACFDRADLVAKDSLRAALAREGIQVCRKWLERAPNRGAAHYYLGMNLAQLARTKNLGALPLVKEMEKEWTAAIALEPHVDFAGPDRNLGLLYRDAPGFPLSIGSRTKAEEHLRHAVELDPEYPENHLNLIETHLKRRPSAVAEEDKKLRAIFPSARKQLTGPYWQSPWEDWDARQKKIQAWLDGAKQ